MPRPDPLLGAGDLDLFRIAAPAAALQLGPGLLDTHGARHLGVSGLGEVSEHQHPEGTANGAHQEQVWETRRHNPQEGLIQSWRWVPPVRCAHNHPMPPRRAFSIPRSLQGQLAGWGMGLLLTVAGPVAAAPGQPGGRVEPLPPVLRVGVVDGAPPCSYRDAGDWRGLAVDLWSRIATRERLPYVVSEWPSVQALLEASRNGALDVAVGCINVSPDRLERYRFSLPFQEDGLAVMVLQSRLDLGRSFLVALLTPTLLQLLGGYLAAIGLLALLTWRVEHYAQQPHTVSHGRLRSFSALFQVLATGPGSNALVTTTRGNGIVLMAYLVRIVSASLLVGYLTVNVARQVQETPSARIRSEGDLRGLRVAVRSGTVSESLLRDLNAASSGPKVTIVPLASIRSGMDLLDSRRVDAVLGDNLQLRYLLINAPLQGSRPGLALQGIRPESQAFVFAPDLPAATAERIDRAISALKRNGVVTALRQQAIEPGGTPGR